VAHSEKHFAQVLCSGSSLVVNLLVESFQELDCACICEGLL
jgi:hypothetical protein